MSLLSWFKDKIEHEATKPIYHFIPEGAAAAPMEAGRHYFRLWLSEMYLKNDVKWFQEWHPAVHSLVHFRFGTRDVDIPHLAGSFNLPGFQANNLGKVLPLNYAMTQLMPFNGGTVEMSAGLLAMKGDNFLSRSIKIVGDFAKLLMAPQLSAALAVAGPVADGIQELLSGGDGRLEIGLHQTFVGAGGAGGGNELRPGYVAVVGADERQLDARRLRVANGRLLFEPAQNDSAPLTGFTYMLFRIEAREERDDWAALSSISEPYNKAVAALGDQEVEKAESLLRAAVAAALQSPDLTRADRARVVTAMKAEYDGAKLALGAARAEPLTLDAVMRKAISVDEALSAPEPSFEELFSR